MGNEKKETLGSFEDDLHSKIIVNCLMKCLNRHEISSEVKMKILSILYENNDSLPVTLDSTRGGNLSVESFNPLGVDDDLINNPVRLTPGEVEELKKLILDEIRKFHSFCSTIRSDVSPMPLKENCDASAELLDNLLKVHEGLELTTKLMQRSESLQSEALKLSLELNNSVISKASKLFLDERALLEELDKAMSSEERGEALENVENILEKKIKENKMKINKLSFQVSEYDVI